MLRHRCPWCGESLPLHIPFSKSVWIDNKALVCPYCKNKYTPYPDRTNAIILASGLIVLYSYFVLVKKNNISTLLNWILGIVAGICLITLVFEYCRIPFSRKIMKKENLNVKKKQMISSIEWVIFSAGGFFSHGFR